MKDQIGNRLEPGHLVQVILPNGMRINGHVTEVNDNVPPTFTIRLINANQTKSRTLGILKVAVTIEAESDPRSGVCPSVLRIVDPKEREATELTQ